MDLIVDGLLIAGAGFAGIWCWALSVRVRALKSLDSGLGAAIVTLTRQIELARATLEEARTGARDTRQDLAQLAARADAAAAQLRLMLAAAERIEPERRAQAEAALAAPEPARRPRLVRPEAEDDAPASLFADPADAPPKPRRALPLGGPARRGKAAPPEGAEAELIAALSAIASGER